jgi:hypothetical protein
MASRASSFQRQPNVLYFRQPTSLRSQPNVLYFRQPPAPLPPQPRASVYLRSRNSFYRKPKVSLRRQIWSDWPLAKVLLVWLAFGFSVIFYFSDWPRTGPDTRPAIQVSRVSGADTEEIYTGSIVVAPPGANRCWERKFDNRTGQMSSKDLVNCGKEETPETGARMEILRNYFRNR